MRPIDSDALEKAFEESGYMDSCIKEHIDGTPTLDVEFVRRGDALRNKLIEICDTNNGWVDEAPVERFVDYLISNGVTMRE